MNDWEVEMSSHGVEKRVAASGEGEKEEGSDFSLPNGHIYIRTIYALNYKGVILKSYTY
jgi:hypothetical protein